MSINIEEAKDLAKLCKLHFTKSELIAITGKINNILEEVKKVELLGESLEICPKNVADTLREDIPSTSLALEQTFSNTEHRKKDYFISTKKNGRD